MGIWLNREFNSNNNGFVVMIEPKWRCITCYRNEDAYLSSKTFKELEFPSTHIISEELLYLASRGKDALIESTEPLTEMDF